MCGRKVEIAIVAGLPAKGNMNIDACHIICFSHKGEGENKNYDVLNMR